MNRVAFLENGILFSSSKSAFRVWIYSSHVPKKILPRDPEFNIIRQHRWNCSTHNLVKETNPCKWLVKLFFFCRSVERGTFLMSVSEKGVQMDQMQLVSERGAQVQLVSEKGPHFTSWSVIRVAIFTCSRSVFTGWNLKACLMMTTHTSTWVPPPGMGQRNEFVISKLCDIRVIKTTHYKKKSRKNGKTETLL